MKIKLTEQQILRISKMLNEQDDSNSGSSVLDSLTKFGKYLYDYINGNSEDNQKIPQPIGTDVTSNSGYVPGGEDMMHPLGHRSQITSNFGNRNSGIGSTNHKGVDIATPSGSPVYAPLNGTVISAKDTTPNGCGGFVKLDHNVIETKFCHLSKWVVRQGDKVKRGQIIGYTGGGPSDPYRGTSSGPHLHYEILNNSGVAMNPTSVQSNLT